MVKEWIKISDLLFFQEGPGVRNTQYTQSGVKLLNVANLVNGKVDLSTSDRYISEDEAYGRYKHFLCDDGDFIIASSGIKVEYFDRKMGFVDSSMLPLCMNTSTIRFKVIDSKRLNIKYFMYYLKSIHFKQQLSKFITGSAQLNFGPSHLKKMNMPLVSLKEQNVIVEKLSKVELLLDKYNGEIKLLDELIKARFVEMFGDPVTNDMLWNTDVLKDICTKIGSGSTPRGGKESYIDEGISFIRSMNVHNAYFEYKDLAHITIDQAEKLNNVVVEHDDLLFNITGASVARCCVVPSDVLPARVNQHVCILRCREKINPIFLQGLLVNENYQGKLLQIAKSGATREAINKQQLESLEIMIPPLELQNQFASFVEEIDKSRYRIQKSLEASQELFDSLMQEYFG
ncbi:restriction endonuclease subunit S [Catenibacterium mitsuokai]|uniref:restriction endonuclease subunit S n=1 Tax=Catenibacterium mitsuokai TaxID=100886 RepID=UPI003F90677D